MPFVLAILLFVAFICLESSEKSAREKISQSWCDNYVAGYREYVYAWYIYWNEVVPRVYEEYRRLSLEENWDERRQYNIDYELDENFFPRHGHTFDKVGNYVYGEWVQHYCIRKAKEHMIAEGRKPYNACWAREHDKYKLNEDALEEERRPLEDRNMAPLFFLNCKFEDPDAYIPEDDDIRQMIPPETDRRRYECIALDGKRIWKLPENRRF